MTDREQLEMAINAAQLYGATEAARLLLELHEKRYPKPEGAK